MPAEELTFLLAHHMQSYAKLLLETLIDNRTRATLTSRSLQSRNLSSSCRNELIKVSSSALKNEFWALKVFDSNGRLQSGLISGSLLNPIGNYDQCLSENYEPIRHFDRGTQYCVAEIDLSQESKQLALFTGQPKALFASTLEGGRAARVGLCSPATCTPDDLINIGNHLIDYVTTSSVSIQKIECYHQGDDTPVEENLLGDIGLLFTVIILVLIISASTAATILDSIYDDASKRRRRLRSMGSSSVVLNWLIDSFSLLRGYKSLTAKRATKNLTSSSAATTTVSVEKVVNLRALDGLRAISMLWTITIHSYNFGFLWLLFDNIGQVDDVYKNIWVQWIANGTFSVDNFFLISGLLAYLKHFQIERQSSKRSPREPSIGTGEEFDNQGIPTSTPAQRHHHIRRSRRLELLTTISLRYLRLAPTMMAMILFSVFLLPLLAYGPNWSSSTTMFESWCRSNWHLNLMMAHNFISTPNMCFSHSWYVAADFQLFCLVQILLFIIDFMATRSNFCIKLIYTRRLLISGAIIAQIFVATIVYILGLPSAPLIRGDSLEAILNYQALVYIKPYYWISSYFLGSLLAIHIASMAQNKPAPRSGKHRNTTTDATSTTITISSSSNGWMFAFTRLAPIILMALLLISMLPFFRNAHPMSGLSSTVYALLARPLWSISLLFLIVDLIKIERTESKSRAKLMLVTRFLSCLVKSNVWLPISRLSYCAYLLHPVVMAMFYGSRLETFQFSHSLLLYFTLGNIFITYFGALILFLTIEFPIQTTIKQIIKLSQVFQRSLEATKRKLSLQKQAGIVSSRTTSSRTRSEFLGLSSRPR